MDALPTWVDREAWEGFVEMRRAKGKRTPFTARAAKMILKTLQELKDAGHDANAALDQSTTNGWSDVYEPRGKEIRRAAGTSTANDWIKAQDEHASKATPMPENLKRMIRRVV
jgi:hypothetical protein